MFMVLVRPGSLARMGGNMKATITVATSKDLNCGSTRIKHSGMPGLFFAELVRLLAEYDRFEKGKVGTRFDCWL